MILIVSLVNYIGLLLSGDFNKKEYLLLSLTPLFTSIPLFSLNLFISTLLKKKNKTIGISLGLVFIFYFLNLVSEMSEEVEFLKYISIYTLADVRNVIMNVEYNPSIILISIILSIFFISLSFIKYQKKELV
jgi:ABC-2 type transport system permease protein